MTSGFDRTPEEATAYRDGWARGYEAGLIVSRRVHEPNRVEAFAALRRAAEVIRKAERLHLCKYEANYIRAAIRAAIGLDTR